jgi:hypothetical protein
MRSLVLPIPIIRGIQKGSRAQDTITNQPHLAREAKGASSAYTTMKLMFTGVKRLMGVALITMEGSGSRKEGALLRELIKGVG